MPKFRVSALSVVNQIKSNLQDRYVAGYPILKELLQNADDAEARRFRIDALPGWPGAANPLLREPGLLVVNDGVFREKDERDIVSFGESGKATDSEAIGKFGIGQKAVFHLCDAFVVYAHGHDRPFNTVVNPFLNVEVDGNVSRNWELLSDADLNLLRDEAQTDFPDRCLVLWLPARREALQPAPGTGFSSDFPNVSTVVEELARPDDLRTLMTALRHLESVEVHDRGRTCCVVGIRGGSERLLGPRADLGVNRSFRGTIETHPDGSPLSFVGRETMAQGGRLEDLQRSPHWPKTITVFDPEPQPEKGEPHGAVTLLRGAMNGPSQLRMSWAVFLPVSEDSEVIIPIEGADLGRFHLLLHGYFFVDSGRLRIEGLSERIKEDEPSDAAGLCRAWNAELRDSVVLPLIPAVLKDALDSKMTTSAQLVDLVAALAGSSWFRCNRDAICERNSLVRVLEAPSRINWRILPSETILRPLPKTVAGTPQRIGDLFADIHSWAQSRNTFLCVEKSALTKEPMLWTADELCSLFSSLSTRAFQSRLLAPLLADFLDSVEPKESCREVVGPHLLSALRKALHEEAALAPSESVSRILAHVPSALLFPLPSSVEHRHVFRDLASAPADVLPVRRTWTEDGVGSPTLSDNDLKTLLYALERHLDGELTDQAATAALAFLIRAGQEISELAKRPEYASIKVLRVRDLRAGGVVSLSLGALLERARETSLFGPSPAANSMLPLLVKALPGASPVIVEGRTANFLRDAGDSALTLQVAGKASVFKLINNASDFGSTNARARLLRRLQPVDSDDRTALRRLCTGAHEAGDLSASIWVMDDIPDGLERIVTALLRKSGRDFLVPSDIAVELTPWLRAHLGMKTLDGESLEALLEKHSDEIARLTMAGTEREAFLLANLSDSLLRDLPIHARSDETIGDLKDVFREADWPIPRSLREHVLTVQPCADPSARERQQELVPGWSPESQIQTVLSHPEPHGLRKDILDALAKLSADHSQLNPQLSDNLRMRTWLVAQDTPVAPEDVLALPEAVDREARVLMPKEGGRPPFWPARTLGADILNHPGFGYLKSCVLPDERSSFEALALMIEDAGIVGRLGLADDYPMEEFTTLAKANANMKLPGWPLLAAVLTALRDESDRAAKIVEAFSELSDADADATAGHLDSLAGIAAGRGTNSAAARRAYLRGFEVIAKWPQASRRRVLGGTRVPNMAGGWRIGHEVIENGSGIALKHMLEREYASLLGTHEAHRVQVSDPSDDGSRDPVEGDVRHRKIVDIDLAEVEAQSADQQRKFLQDWRGRLPSDLVIVWLGLVGRNSALIQVANEWEADATTDVDTLWDDLDDSLKPTLHPNPLAVEVDERRYVIERIKGDRVRAIALSGEPFDVPLGNDDAGLIVGNLHKSSQGIRGRDGKIRSLIRLQIRNFDPGALNYGDASALFRGLVETVAADCLWLRMPNQWQALQEILDKAVDVNQTTLEDTECLLRDRLPTILAELKLPAECHAQQALRKYQREEGRIVRLSGASQEIEALKAELWQTISDSKVSGELLAAMRTKIQEFGYTTNRVLFELFQNAEDAYRQLDTVPKDACFRVMVSSEEFGGFRAIHWGRPINHLGSDPEEGRSLGHDRDLLNMLLINFSEKRPGKDLTGKFGLGFKCVHMLSDDVGIASGPIALRTIGGLLPKDWSHGIDEAETLKRDGGSKATVIDVPFSAETAALGKTAARMFRASITWMPALARSIRRIEIDDGDPVTVECEDAPLLDENAIRVVAVSDSGRRRALRFDLANGYCLLIRIGPAGPVAFSDDVGRLWNLAPLEENLRSGWLLNGPFSVDPGRGRLAGSIEDQAETFGELGRILGDRLLRLHDLSTKDWKRFASALDLDTSEDSASPLFWSCLFDLFGRDFDDPLTRKLHVDGCGYARLVSDHAVVPTGLTQSFDSLVRASDVKHYTDGALSETVVLEKVLAWPSLIDLQGTLIASEIAGQLGKLGFGGIRATTLTDLLRREMGNENRISVECAARLGNVINLSAVEDTPLDQERRRILDTARLGYFRCQDGAWRAVRDISSRSGSSEDEKLICDFAPENALLDKSYEGTAVEFFKVARRESGYGPQASLLSEWAWNANDDVRRRAVLRYIISGRQGRALAEEMQNDLPVWLPRPAVRLLSEPLLSDWSDEDKKRVLLELGAHDRLRVDEPESSNAYSANDSQVVLEAIHDWWTANGDIQRDSYARGIYPEVFSPSQLRAADDRAAWFTMFALACFQSLGRTQDGQHRDFIQRGLREGWWKELTVSQPPSDVQPWLNRLEHWSAPEQLDQESLLWRRTLVDLYTFARGLDEYVQIINRLPQLVQDQGRISLDILLRPSYAPVLGPLGLDAAPINRSLGIGVNWIIRELLRYGVYDSSDENLIEPYCWAPSGRVRELLNALGAQVGDDARMDISPKIHDFVINHLGADRGRFGGDFDLPLQLITRGKNRVALGQCFAAANREAPIFGYAEGGDTEDEPIAGISGE